MADLPIIQFNSWRDPLGYRLDNSKRLVTRNGRPGDKVDALEPLKNKVLYSAFANEVLTPESLLKFVKRYGSLTERGLDQGDDVRRVLWHADQMRALLKIRSVQRDNRGQVKTFGFPNIVLHAAVDWERNTLAARWVFRPTTFLDGLWLQLGQAITRGACIQICSLCGDLFEVGYPSDRRLDSKFCRDEHRVQYNSRKRSKGNENA
jgi:hypothetical protein